MNNSDKPFILNIDPDWFLMMVEKENNCCISVGGLYIKLKKMEEEDEMEEICYATPKH